MAQVGDYKTTLSDSTGTTRCGFTLGLAGSARLERQQWANDNLEGEWACTEVTVSAGGGQQTIWMFELESDRLLFALRWS